METTQAIDKSLRSAENMKFLAVASLSLFMILYYVGFNLLERNQPAEDNNAGTTVLGVADVKPNAAELKLNNSIAGEAVLELHTDGYTGEAFMDILLIGQDGFQLIDTLCYPGLQCEIDEMGNAVSIRVNSVDIAGDSVVKLAYLFYDTESAGKMTLDNSGTEDSVLFINGYDVNYLADIKVDFEFGNIK